MWWWWWWWWWWWCILRPIGMSVNIITLHFVLMNEGQPSLLGCTPPKKNLAEPYFANCRWFLHKMLTKVVWLIKILKNSLGLLILCGGCADLVPFSTYLCKKKNKNKNKKHFYQELRDLGPFYFVSSRGNLGPPRAKSLQIGGLSFLPSRRKIEPVTTLKMASHLMDTNIVFQGKKCPWLILIIINTLKWRHPAEMSINAFQNYNASRTNWFTLLYFLILRHEYYLVRVIYNINCI